MILQLDNKYRINGDDVSFNLEKSKVCKTTTKNQTAGEIKWEAFAYYGTLSQALKRYINLKIGDLNGTTTAEQINATINEAEKAIERAIKQK